jgi:hypothetical protein
MSQQFLKRSAGFVMVDREPRDLNAFAMMSDMIMRAETFLLGSLKLVTHQCDDGLGFARKDHEVTCQRPCGVTGTPSCLEASAQPCLQALA